MDEEDKIYFDEYLSKFTVFVPQVPIIVEQLIKKEEIKVKENKKQEKLKIQENKALLKNPIKFPASPATQYIKKQKYKKQRSYKDRKNSGSYKDRKNSGSYKDRKNLGSYKKKYS